MNVIFIKLGGSVITEKNKPYTIRPEILSRISSEIFRFHEDYSETRLVIGHGSGSFGHFAAKKYSSSLEKFDETVRIQNQKAVREIVGKARELHNIVLKAMTKSGLPMVSFPPSGKMTIGKNGAVSFDEKEFQAILRAGKIPLVYGDVIKRTDGFPEIFSTEKIFRVLIPKIPGKYHLQKIIMLTDTDGILDIHGKTCESVIEKDIPLLKQLLPEGTDATGGMVHKLKQSIAFAVMGFPVFITSGKKKDILLKALKNEKVRGTWIR